MQTPISSVEKDHFDHKESGVRMKKMHVIGFYMMFLGLLGVAAPGGAANREDDVKVKSVALLASARGRQQVTASMLQLARERRAELLETAAKSPARVLQVAIPKEVRDRLPSPLAEEIEEQLTLEGVVDTISVEKDGNCRTEHYLTVDGSRMRLNFTADAPDLLTGTTLKATGIKIGSKGKGSDIFVVDAEHGDLTIMGADGGTIVNGGTIIPSNTFGEQRILVLLVNFPGNQSQPWTIEQARTLVFGVPDQYYRENSSNQTWLSGDVFGWFTIPVDTAALDSARISWEARKAATAAGISLSSYTRIVYAFPYVSGAVGNLGTIGGSPSEAWFEGSLGTAKTVIHELGHNFGLGHSNAYDCGTEVLSSNGTSIEYGDMADVMGNTASGHLTAFQKQRLGWLDFGYAPLIEHVSGNGSYSIEPYSTMTSGVKALQIPRSIDPISGKSTYFYLESRQAVGFDAWLAGTRYATSILGGVLLHLGTENDYRSSALLDATPASQSIDWNDPALAVGKSYHDPVSGVTVAVGSVSSGGAQIQVTFDQPVCVASAPLITVNPAQSVWMAAGGKASFELTIRNGDSAACSSSSFNLSVQAPNGWSATLSPSALSLAPGASAVATLSIVSSFGAVDGYYPVTSTVQGSNGRSASLNVTCAISAALANRPPIAQTDVASTAENTAVKIFILANDSDPDGDLLSISTFSQGSNGTVALNSDGSLIYLPKRRFKGIDQFSYAISDGRGGTANAIVSVTVGGATVIKKGR